jgi:hypothetical protein
VPAHPVTKISEGRTVQLGMEGRSVDCFFVVNSTAFKGTARNGLRFDAVLLFRAFGFWSLITVPHITSGFDSRGL